MFLELATGLLGATTFTVVVNSWLTHSRLRRINSLLEKGEPARFLEEVEREIRRAPGEPLMTLLQINRAGGLVYTGSFEEALRVLRGVDQSHFLRWRGEARRLLTALYYNNLLYTLLLSRRYDEARAALIEAGPYLEQRDGEHQLDLCIRGTLAVYHYFAGDRRVARQTFEELSRRDWPEMFRACNLYFLGRLDLAEGNFEQGLARVQQAARMAPRSYLADEPRRLAEHVERVGNPGEGTRNLAG